MAVTPSSLYDVQLDLMRTLIANCAAFRTATGAANVTAAKAFVHFIEADLAVDTTGQDFFCIVDFGGTRSFSVDSMGSGNHFTDEGSIGVLWHKTISEANEGSLRDTLLELTGVIGDIWEQMRALSGTDDFLNVVDGSTTEGPYASSEEEEKSSDDYWAAQRDVFIWRTF